MSEPPRGLLNLDPDAGPIQLARYLPTPPLNQLVEHLWSIRWDLRKESPFTSETLPYPSVHLVLENGTWMLQGLVTRSFHRTLVDAGGVFGIKFVPGGLRPLIDGSVARFTDQRTDARSVLDWIDELPDDVPVGEPEADASLVADTEGVLRRHLPSFDERVADIGHLVQAIADARDIVRVEQLVDRSGLSLRTLQRLFRDYVGVSPKWVIQRYRLFEAADRLAAGDADGAEVAHALGYFDQAHFIHDFKAMTGRSPRAFATTRIAN